MSLRVKSARKRVKDTVEPRASDEKDWVDGAEESGQRGDDISSDSAGSNLS
jgi:hypothetical protein